MATAIFFGGRRINIPGAYSKIDASALAGLSPGAVGIVALIGEAEGGVPLTVDSTFADHTRSESILETYRSGDLRIGGSFAFAPSNDEAIPGGAQRVVAVKVNPALQSALTLVDAAAADSIVLTSVDYGLFTAQINVLIEAGTLQGQKISILFESTTETFDDVGGDAVFDALYTPGADGYDAMTALITAGAFTAIANKTEVDLTAQVTAAVPAGLPAGLEAVSDNAGDVQTLTVYGLVGVVATQETITLAGLTIVPTSVVLWDKVLGAALSSAALGTITLRVAGAGATSLTFTAGQSTRGIVQVTNGIAAGVLTMTGGADAAEDVAVFGLNASGAPVGERFDGTASATTPVVGTQVFSEIQVMALGDDAGLITSARLDFTAISINTSLYTTVSKVVDRLNALAGMTATALVSNPTTFLMSTMDFVTTPANLLTPAAEFFANLNEVIKAINNGSGLVSATRATGASLPPANFSSAVYLIGGTEGTTTISQWQAAFTLLKSRRVNIVVPISRDPAVHQLLATHLIQRAGQLRSEANGYVGIATVDGAGETKTNIKSAIQVLGTRHISALSEEPERFDPDTGLATFYPPQIYACIAAGMQAGSPVGEPLTFKRPNITDIRRDASWTPIDDAEELIDAGLMFTELQDGVGFRFVRSVTTHLADDNVVFTEMSANESANAAVFEFRTQLEQRIGRRGLVGTVAGIKGLANDVLSRLIDDEIIFGYQSLEVEQIGDVFPVSVEIAPILPINFIPITVHLVAARAAA